MARRICAVLLVVPFILRPVASEGHDLVGQASIAVFSLQSNTCAGVQPAARFTVSGPNYIPKYQTIAHKFLTDEQGAGDVTPAMYAALDTLIDEGQQALPQYQDNLSGAQGRQRAVASMKAIDCILLRHHFVYPGHGLVQSLSDGLGPTSYSGLYLDELQRQQHNLRRKAFFDGPGDYYVVDCDIASFLFMAIGETMKYPIHLVEIPQHNFVRWDLPDGSSVDFETMDGAETNDQYYLRNWLIPPTFAAMGQILKSLTAQEASAYHDELVGISYSWRADIPKMLEFYNRSIAADPYRSGSFNNLAWYYAAFPDIAQRDGNKAVEFGLKAVAVMPDGDVLDTLACAYAQQGDFAKAIATEDKAIAAGYTPFLSDLAQDRALFVAGKTCNDPDFGRDPKPFRPNAMVVADVDERHLLRLH